MNITKLCGNVGLVCIGAFTISLLMARESPGTYEYKLGWLGEVSGVFLVVCWLFSSVFNKFVAAGGRASLALSSGTLLLFILSLLYFGFFVETKQGIVWSDSWERAVYTSHIAVLLLDFLIFLSALGARIDLLKALNRPETERTDKV